MSAAFTYIIKYKVFANFSCQCIFHVHASTLYLLVIVMNIDEAR